MKQASEAFNLLAGWAVQNKIGSKPKLHSEYYFLLRTKYPELPSAYHQVLRDTLVESLKSIHANHPAKKWTIVPSKKQYSGLRLNARLLTVRGNQVTFSTVGKRVKTIIQIPDWFATRYPEYYQTSSGTISYDKYRKRFYLNLIYKTETVPVISKPRTETVGLDRGVYNLVTTSDGVNYGSKQVRAKRREHLFLRKKLQQKGTRSAKRLLKKRSGKEKRFMLDYNHKLVNTIIKTNPNTGTFVLETLTGIRNHRKGKKMNTFLSQWSYHQLETILTYKAETLGIMVKHIDPRYTSQACNQCGVINKNNRKKNKYSCECGWEAHADVNAALNIRDLGVSGRMKLSQSLQVGQGVVNHPNEPEQVLIVSGSSPEARPLGN
jgi:IS605 OrfB family transposase